MKPFSFFKHHSCPCRKKCKSHEKNYGFTLLEVMVSLLIVALALTALVKGTGQKVNAANDLRDKTFAQWVAINKITEWRSQKLISSRTLTGDDTMGKQDWYWVATFLKTENKKILRVKMSVFKDEQSKKDKESPTVVLHAFLSKL